MKTTVKTRLKVKTLIDYQRIKTNSSNVKDITLTTDSMPPTITITM